MRFGIHHHIRGFTFLSFRLQQNALTASRLLTWVQLTRTNTSDLKNKPKERTLEHTPLALPKNGVERNEKNVFFEKSVDPFPFSTEFIQYFGRSRSSLSLKRFSFEHLMSRINVIIIYTLMRMRAGERPYRAHREDIKIDSIANVLNTLENPKKSSWRCVCVIYLSWLCDRTPPKLPKKNLEIIWNPSAKNAVSIEVSMLLLLHSRHSLLFTSTTLSTEVCELCVWRRQRNEKTLTTFSVRWWWLPNLHQTDFDVRSR